MGYRGIRSLLVFRKGWNLGLGVKYQKVEGMRKLLDWGWFFLGGSRASVSS